MQIGYDVINWINEGQSVAHYSYDCAVPADHVPGVEKRTALIVCITVTQYVLACAPRKLIARLG